MILNGSSLKYVKPKFKDDREVVYSSVENFPQSIFHAGFNFKFDQKLILNTIKYFPEAFKFAINSLKCDIKFYTESYETNHLAAF